MNNLDRASKGQTAMSAYTATNAGSAYRLEPDEDRLGDLLCDLRHWAAARDIDFDAANGTSETNFSAEVDEEDENTCDTEGCDNSLLDDEGYNGYCGECADKTDNEE